MSQNWFHVKQTFKILWNLQKNYFSSSEFVKIDFKYNIGSRFLVTFSKNLLVLGSRAFRAKNFRTMSISSQNFSSTFRVEQISSQKFSSQFRVEQHRTPKFSSRTSQCLSLQWLVNIPTLSYGYEVKNHWDKSILEPINGINNYDLNDPKNIHTGKKPFECKECNIEFTRSASLKRHQRRHAGEKPFGCKMCNKSFSQKYTLITHE